MIKSTYLTEKKLKSHYKNHKNDFPGLISDEYVEKAKDLLSPNFGMLCGFISTDGFSFMYQVSIYEFALEHPGGSISTFYKPENGEMHWNE